MTLDQNEEQNYKNAPYEDESNDGRNSDKPQTAINEETGEINWDCPCLKGALEPPCGEYFKAAFSCFVASTSEPKGEECLEPFKLMQDCYRAHPEIYMKSDEDDSSNIAEENVNRDKAYSLNQESSEIPIN